jgi:hypothetical protein
MADTLMPVPVSNVTFTFSLLIPTKVHKIKVLPSSNQKYFSLMQNLTQQITAIDTIFLFYLCVELVTTRASPIGIPQDIYRG